jgi:hypothetical protein
VNFGGIARRAQRLEAGQLPFARSLVDVERADRFAT